jgi:hypothetical protein
MTEEWTVYRGDCTPARTIGELWFPHAAARTCYTLEDPVRPAGVKMPGNTAIPAGRFRVRLAWSPHFRCLNPHVEGVPNFTGVELHGGNSPVDVEGCTALAIARTVDSIFNSEPAMRLVNERLLAAERMTIEVWVTWTNAARPAPAPA